MKLKLTEWLGLLCFCAVGVQVSYQFIAEMRSVTNNCAAEGGFCINVIPPPPPPQRQQQRRQMGTRTRKGNRPGAAAGGAAKPDPSALGQEHTRLPASAGGGPAASAPGAAVSAGGPAAGAPTTPATANNNNPFSIFDNLFGPSNDPFGQMLGMSMFIRKKRQAAMEPVEAAEAPRIQRGENMFNFLNLHCRMSEFDFGCRSTGGMCCLPHL